MKNTTQDFSKIYQLDESLLEHLRKAKFTDKDIYYLVLWKFANGCLDEKGVDEITKALTKFKIFDRDRIGKVIDTYIASYRNKLFINKKITKEDDETWEIGNDT